MTGDFDEQDEPIVWREGLAQLARTVRDHEPAQAEWNPELVLDRLMEAFALLERAVGRTAPKGYGTAMPAYVHDWGDLLGQAAAGNLHEGGNRIRLGATAAQVTAMEQAVAWPQRHVEDDRFRIALLSYVACKVKRRPWKDVVKGVKGRPGLGCSMATAHRRKDAALSLISLKLAFEGVKP